MIRLRTMRRPPQRYDDQLRISSNARDLRIGTERDVSRSTGDRWLTAAPSVVVSLRRVLRAPS